MDKERAKLFFLSVILSGSLLWPSGAAAQRLLPDSYYMHSLTEIYPPVLPHDEIKLVFIGDVMLHAKQIDKEYGPFLEDLKPLFSEADVAVANMETTLAGEPYSGYPAFSSPDNYADYVASLGTDVFLTANNHTMDMGTKGFIRTLKYYAGMEGVKFTGGTIKEIPDSMVNPLILKVKGARIALLNFTYGSNKGLPDPSTGARLQLMKKEDVSVLLKRAQNAGADYIIALPHWGVEYDLNHSDSQEKMARWLADEGVDLIIGSHPHVVQDTCIIKTADGRRVPVIYSLGNAVSNMSIENSRLELAATVTLSRFFPGQVTLESLHLEFLWCTLPGMLLENTYKTVIVREREGKRDLWLNGKDYDNMMATLRRVKTKTGIGKD